MNTNQDNGFFHAVSPSTVKVSELKREDINFLEERLGFYILRASSSESSWEIYGAALGYTATIQMKNDDIGRLDITINGNGSSPERIAQLGFAVHNHYRN